MTESGGPKTLLKKKGNQLYKEQHISLSHESLQISL